MLITRDALYKRVERELTLNAPTRPVEELSVNQNDIDVSSISSPSTGSHITNSTSGSQDLSESEAVVSSSKAGRPKGSTMQKKREDINSYEFS